MTITNQNSNPEQDLAEQFAVYTNKSFFLTGKAGTGKTTLLKKITEQTLKNYAVVAPTGVAAINAGGVTIHSLFMLPISAFIPSNDDTDINVVMNWKMLSAHFRFSESKRKVIRELDLLIIDEVSMVRCDILDAIDFILRYIRRRQEPFGGVQVILIGDMFQLPPVIREHEWSILKNYYNSPYFFDALVWKRVNPVHIELQKIYRQQDATFIRILNNIRNKKMDAADYAELEKRYDPNFKPTAQGYVLLSTHNRKADEVNTFELHKLPGKLYSYEAEIEGEFPENMFPCDKILNLKAGAQVMFIKNDMDGAYYNGKLATVESITDNGIKVIFNDSQKSYILKKERWENVNYHSDDVTGKFSRNELGVFFHYPLRLAWAITIHKSQGLTFDKVIIDAGDSFASGQVYVALSRCRSLEGIVLHSRIHQQVLFNDDKINAFAGMHDRPEALEQTLSVSKINYEKDLLRRLFDFNKLNAFIAEWSEIIEEKNIPEKVKVLEINKKIQIQAQKIIEVSQKFAGQLQKLAEENLNETDSISLLKERCYKAIDYFTEEIFTGIITPVHAHLSDFAYKSKVKKYLLHVQLLEKQMWHTVEMLYQATLLNEKIYGGEIKYSRSSLNPLTGSANGKTKVKGSTYQDTLDLFQQGKTIDEMALIRTLTKGTIKSHLARWIGLGKINIVDVLPAERILKLEKILKDHGAENFAALKSALGESLDYSELRMVTNYLNYKKKMELQESLKE